MYRGQGSAELNSTGEVAGWVNKGHMVEPEGYVARVGDQAGVEWQRQEVQRLCLKQRKPEA